MASFNLERVANTKTVATAKRRAWTTAVPRRQLMAISGIVFVLFAAFPLLQQPPDVLGTRSSDHYALAKKKPFVPVFHGGFIWVFRAAMVLMLVILSGQQQ